MTFTYASDFTLDRDVIRLTIGDTVENTGVKPDGSNFSDEEIAGMVTLENTAELAIARIYENLATLYATYVDTKIGSRDEKLSKISDNYLKLAQRWRDEHGGGSGSTIVLGSIDWGISEDDPT